MLERQLTLSEVPINSVVIHVFTWCVLLSGHKRPLGMIINCMGHFHIKSQQPYYFVFQNSEKAAMFQTNSVGGELFSFLFFSFLNNFL